MEFTDEEAQEALEYWTPERRGQAQSAVFPTTPESGPHDVSLDGELVTPRSLAPSAAPPTSPQTDALGRSSLEGLQTSADLSTAQRWNYNWGYPPSSTIGKLYAVTTSGDPQICTASVINTPHGSALWTAAHCIYEPFAGAYTNVVFEPQVRDGLGQRGTWSALEIFVPPEWAQTGEWRYDIGLVLTAPGGENDQSLEAELGSQGYDFGHGWDPDSYGASPESNAVNFGYPLEGYNRDDFDGGDLWYCTGLPDANPSTPGRLSEGRMSCDMGRGASGGPWISRLHPVEGTGTIIGSNSHYNTDPEGERIDGSVYSGSHDILATALISNAR
ncbi:V8-like Glu-specific endopeptidase [Spinactinospora alkalitolerans]|uniref:V8-like Glu-specific endopeptidase n=1 Tax=Spinactinospora alkalitolerans TaxID=687207 RepID=A0A852TRR1_9ACTN|nr:trypsin-like serine protease [Spinactinospora alkalitolerans]NYE46699.1 V8-like Glu-specific endopeptidase [Spinactinospora alkalitolerans]